MLTNVHFYLNLNSMKFKYFIPLSPQRMLFGRKDYFAVFMWDFNINHCGISLLYKLQQGYAIHQYSQFVGPPILKAVLSQEPQSLN